MQVPFSLYDLLGYILPGAIVIIIAIILLDPCALHHLPNDATKGLAQYLPKTGIQGFFYLFICYLVGFILRACREVLSKIVPKWEWLKRLDIDHGKFIKKLLNPKYRDCSDDFSSYSNEFVHRFKNQIEEIFGVNVDKIESDEEYKEIFNFCRMTLIKQNSIIYARALVLFSRYGSARGMVSVCFIAMLGFGFRGIYLCINWLLIILAATSFFLFWLFLAMYKKHLEDYRNTILYGFYEYAVTREESGESRTFGD